MGYNEIAKTKLAADIICKFLRDGLARFHHKPYLQFLRHFAHLLLARLQEKRHGWVDLAHMAAELHAGVDSLRLRVIALVHHEVNI